MCSGSIHKHCGAEKKYPHLKIFYQPEREPRGRMLVFFSDAMCYFFGMFVFIAIFDEEPTFFYRDRMHLECRYFSWMFWSCDAVKRVSTVNFSL